MLSSVETELSVHFCPHFANTFSVSCNFTKIVIERNIENLIKKYQSNNSKAALISLIVCAIFTSIVFLTETKYLLWLNFLILPLLTRFLVVSDFRKWRNNTAKIFNIDNNKIETVAEKHNISARKIFQNEKEKIFFAIFSIVIISLSTFFAWEKIQLKNFGKESVAEVFQINSGTKSSFALLQYSVNAKRYTTPIKLQVGNKLSERIYYGKKHIKAKIGQKFRIRYSEKNPEIVEIVSDYPIE